jgi:HlyD family type I secretion membrane fusion protein
MKSLTEDTRVSSTMGIPRARARFLAQAIQLEEHGISHIMRVALYSIIGLMVAILIWMSLTEISEVTVAGGKIVPVGYIHNIQHLEGGLIGDIFVEEGDRVEAGELLVNFAPPASQSELDQLVIRRAILEFDMARLDAIRANRKPVFGEAAKRYPQLTAKAEDAFRTQQASYASELEVVDARIEQRISELDRQKNQVMELENETALLQRQVDIRSELAERNVISLTELLRIQSEHASMVSALRSAKDSVLVASNALTEERKQRSDTVAKHENEIEKEAARAQNELAKVESAMVKAVDKVDRLKLYAPVAGIVQSLSVTAINAVVRPGEVIMQIVPVDDELIVESRVMPDEVGYIHAGQIADIRVDSYDSSRYGSINGVVRQISPSTYLDENANPYYKVKVGLDKSWLGQREGQMTVIPGMTVQVDIITGSKTIMQYLLKPVTRGFQSAFTQR